MFEHLSRLRRSNDITWAEIRSPKHSSLRGKLAELSILISQLPNLHILAFTESWLSDDITDGEISLPG